MIDADVLENPSLEPKNNCLLHKVQSWKIRLCQEIRTPYPTHDDPNTASHLVVSWRIPDFIRTLDGVDFQHGWPDLDKYIYLCIVIPILSTKNERTSHKFPGLWCIVVVSTVLSKASIFTFPPRCT